MVRNNGQRNRKVELILKSSLSSDCSLKFESMKSDLVVIAGQQTAVNTFPFLVHKLKARLAANKATWLESMLVVKKIWQVRSVRIETGGPETKSRPIKTMSHRPTLVCYGEDTSPP